MSTQPASIAWKSIDDALRLIERVATALKPLHRDVEIGAIGGQLRLRRQRPFYVYHSSSGVGEIASDDMPLPGAAGAVMAKQPRPGVLVLDSNASASLQRHFCDVSGTKTAAAFLGGEPTAPLLSDALPPEELDGALAVFGTARQAWLSVDELQRILTREVERLDRLIERVKHSAAVSTEATGEGNYLRRLETLLGQMIQEERERVRDRETLQRNFELTVRKAVSQVDTNAIVLEERRSAIDRFRPRGLRSLIGKTQIDAALHDAAINALVETVERVARHAADDRVHSLARTIEKVEPGQFSRHFGRSAEQWLTRPETSTRATRTIHEAIADSGRGFHVRLERLGAINRVMRARMEIAGLLMLTFLAFSAFGVRSEVRSILSIATLIVALVIALFSYLTSHIVEEERLEEEMQRLRDQLTKAGADAAARSYAAGLTDTIEQIEELRDEVGTRLAAGQPARRERSQAAAPGIVTILTTLRSDLTRELAGTTGPGAIKQQLGQLLAPGGALRVSLP